MVSPPLLLCHEKSDYVWVVQGREMRECSELSLERVIVPWSQNFECEMPPRMRDIEMMRVRNFDFVNM